MPYHRYAIFAFLALSCLSKGRSQTPEFRKDSVKVDLNGKTFDKILPYDEPFKINGSIDKKRGIEVVELCYELKKTNKSTLIPTKWKRGTSITSVNSDSTSFSLNCNGIAPNRDYIFVFKLFSSFAEEKKKAKIKKIIADAWMDFLAEKKGNYSNADLDRLANIVDSTIKKQLNDCPLYRIKKDCCGQVSVSTVDMTQPVFTLEKIEGKIFDFATEIDNPISNYDANEATDRQNILSHLGDSAMGFLKRVQDTGLIVKSFAAYLENKVDTSDRFKSVTVLQFTRSLLEIISPDNGAGFPLLDQLLKGEGAYKNKLVVSSAKHDLVFLNFLAAYLTEVVQVPLRNGSGEPGRTQLRQFRNALVSFIDRVQKYYIALEKKEKYSNEMPDLTAGFFAANFVSFEDAVNIDLATSSSPYISIDGGVGYNFGFRNIFAMYGVNFYFVPIRKKILLREYSSSPLLYVLKSTSLTVGLINNYYNSGGNGNRYQSILSGNKDIFVGIGHRFNRAMKFNTGIALYYRKEADPLSTRKTLEAKFAMTLSVDVNLLGAFSTLATALNIK